MLNLIFLAVFQYCSIFSILSIVATNFPFLKSTSHPFWAPEIHPVLPQLLNLSSWHFPNISRLHSTRFHRTKQKRPLISDSQSLIHCLCLLLLHNLRDSVSISLFASSVLFPSDTLNYYVLNAFLNFCCYPPFNSIY